MTEAAEWCRTDVRFREGSGSVVERNGRLGYAKICSIKREKLASDLAQLIGAPVPRVEIGSVEGCGPFAISHIHSLRGWPVAGYRRDYSAAEKVALRAGSGLLPFLAWIGSDDHGRDNNLVFEELSEDRLRVVAVDFEHAFLWRGAEDVVCPPAPAALVANLDPSLVCERLAAIENLAADQIADCCTAFERQPEIGKWIQSALRRRQTLLRAPLIQKGWLG
jgi:hypothetical protein